MSNSENGVNPVYGGLIAGTILITVFVCLSYITMEMPVTQLALYILPVVGFVLSMTTNFISQFISCGTVDAGKALVGGTPSIGTIFLAFFLSYFNNCRIPVASVVAPFYVSKDATSKCCSPTLLLETVEKQYPAVEIASYSFYLFVAMMFGTVIGTSMSAIC